MDDAFFYGEYEIIGNLPLPYSELDFPVMYGSSISNDDKIYLQLGQKFYEMANRDCALYSEFRNNGIGWGVDVELPILKKCIELDSNEPYWEQNNYLTNKDLRNPMFYKEREAICKQFGVSEEEIFLNK